MVRGGRRLVFVIAFILMRRETRALGFREEEKEERDWLGLMLVREDRIAVLR